MISHLYIPGTVVGQTKGGAKHTPLTHRPYRQSLLAVHTVPTAPFAVTIAVALQHIVLESPTIPTKKNTTILIHFNINFNFNIKFIFTSIFISIYIYMHIHKTVGNVLEMIVCLKFLKSLYNTYLSIRSCNYRMFLTYCNNRFYSMQNSSEHQCNSLD